MKRSEAREEVFKLTFQIPFNFDDFDDVIEYYNEINGDIAKTDKKQYLYIMSTIDGVYKNLERLDKVISENLVENWSIDRLSKASLAILRLAVYEILFAEDIANNIIANEAVELAKKYDDDSAPSFVNGVLSGVIKSTKK